MLCGLLPVHKPAGPSSATVVNCVKHLTKIRVLGHSGTLDPAASGVMVLAFERATRLLEYLPTDKTYRALIRLGITTDTLDARGTILTNEVIPSFSQEFLLRTVEKYQGPLLQTPPMVSAIHFQGKRLYKLARQGESISLPPRPITIFAIQLLQYTAPELEIMVHCSSGTYIRTLAADIGKDLGCGAHLAQLQRTVCNGFALEECISLDALAELVKRGVWEQSLIDPNYALRAMPDFFLDAAAAVWVGHGRVLELPLALQAMAEDQLIRLRWNTGELLAVAKRSSERLVMEKVMLGTERGAG